MFMTPQTSEKPTATRASRPPSRRPYTVDWRNSVMGAVLARSAARPRPLELRRRLVLRVDRRDVAVLDLDDRHRLRHILTPVVELDRAEERLGVEARHRVTHLVRV